MKHPLFVGTHISQSAWSTMALPSSYWRPAWSGIVIRTLALLLADMCFRGCDSALGWLLCRGLDIDARLLSKDATRREYCRCYWISTEVWEF